MPRKFEIRENIFNPFQNTPGFGQQKIPFYSNSNAGKGTKSGRVESRPGIFKKFLLYPFSSQFETNELTYSCPPKFSPGNFYNRFETILQPSIL